METIVAELVKQIITVAGAAIASGFIATAITQIFKWKLFAGLGKKYPVHTAVVVSIATSAGAIYLLNMVLLTSVLGYIVFAVATILVATQTYDLVKKAVDSLKGPEAF